MQTVRLALSSFPAPEGVDVDANLPGEGRFAQAKFLPERDNLPGREFTFGCGSARSLRKEALSGNELFEEFEVGSDRRVLASFPTAMVDSSMPSF
jgi:hypothetical protein